MQRVARASQLSGLMVALILMLALGGHLFAPQVEPVESRTVLRPTDGGDDDESQVIQEELLGGGNERDLQVQAGLKRPVRLAAILRELAATIENGDSLKASSSSSSSSSSSGTATASTGASLGLRRIQRQPRRIVGLDSQTSGGARMRQWQAQAKEGDTEFLRRQNATSGLQFLWPADANNYQAFSGPLKRSAKREINAISKGNDATKHKFIYVISPISELVHPFQAERFAQGYKNLLPLSGNYEIGLQKMSHGQLRTPLTGAFDASSNVVAGVSAEPVGCQTTRTMIQLTRDQIDPISGQLIRQCTGSVELNTCEGSCLSGVQPSIKSPTGLAKRCSCCNEAAFRRVQVRLSQCSLAPIGEYVSKQQGVVAVSGEEVNGKDFMDVEVDEPIDCGCRQCDSLI